MNAKSELDRTLAAARALAAKAGGEGREFTDHELAVAAELQRRAAELEPRVRQAESDAAVKAAIDELGLGIGAEPLVRDDRGGLVKASTTDTATKTAPARVSPRVKATGGTGQWGDAVVRTCSDSGGHFKALLSGGAVPVSVPLNPEPVRMGEPVLSLRQMIPTIRDDVGRWSYLRQVTRTNNAAVVAQGAKKPTSAYTLVRVDERARTIATLSEPITRQDLSDAVTLQTFIDTEMRLDVEVALENQIINGTGTGEQMTGIGNVSGSQAQAWSSDLLETTRKAVTKLEVINLAPSGWVFHPADWETIELLADNEGNYFLGGGAQSLPVDRAARRLWGVPVAVSTAVTAGVGYLADFMGSTELHVREDAVIDWTESMYDPDRFGTGDGGTLFEGNLIVFRCEMRAGLSITRPAGIVEVDLTA